MDADADADACARDIAEAIMAGDAACRALGIALVEARAGRATLTLEVEVGHANSLGICHGGVIFTLADQAFALACNGHGDRAVAQHCAVTYLQPGRVGDRLTAQAIEVARQGRSGVYDIVVTRRDGTTVALMRGQSRLIAGRHGGGGSDDGGGVGA